MTIGQPVPMQRPRKYRNHWLNPSKAVVDSFKQAALQARPVNEVMFPKGVPVVVDIQFHMRRPKSHFRNGFRWWTALTRPAQSIIADPSGADIDNLAKLVLDAMNGVVYYDDCQVVKLTLAKLKDNELDCRGRTVVSVGQFMH